MKTANAPVYYFASLFPLLCPSTNTHASIVKRQTGPHIASVRPLYSPRGSSVLFKTLRSSSGWERCVSYSAVWHQGMHSYTLRFLRLTRSLSLFLSAPLLSDLQEWQQRELREEEGGLWRQGYRALALSERRDRIKQKMIYCGQCSPLSPLSFVLPVCLCVSVGVRTAGQHLSSADLRCCALTSCHVNTSTVSAL